MRTPKNRARQEETRSAGGAAGSKYRPAGAAQSIKLFPSSGGGSRATRRRMQSPLQLVTAGTTQHQNFHFFHASDNINTFLKEKRHIYVFFCPFLYKFIIKYAAIANLG